MNKYETIINYIRAEIEKGNLDYKKRLPSIRELATTFNCSKTTIIHAYSELEMDEVIYSIPQSGYYVNERYIQSVLSGSINKSNSKVSGLSKSINNQPIDLSWGAPHPEVIPSSDFSSCLSEVTKMYKNTAFSYLEDSFGFMPLRKTLSDFMKKYSIDIDSNNICITSGAQQALHILNSIPFPNNSDTILVEQPAYNLYLWLLEIAKAKTDGILRGFNGLDFNELEEKFKKGNIKFFYTVPNLSNPTGSTLTTNEKAKLIKLAEKYDVYIVEDDYLADLADINNNAPLFSMAPSRVIYIKSFSKLLLPGIRIAAVLLPDEFVQTFQNYKTAFDLSSSVPPQGALDIFISNGMFEKNLPKIKLYYKNKMDYLNEKVLANIPEGSQYSNPDGGLFSLLKLPAGIKADALVNSLNDKNVFVKNGNYFYLKSFNNNDTIRFCVCRTDKRQISEGIDMVYYEINKMLNTDYSPKKQLFEL